MTHPDLLTDEDLATRHEPPKRWFNQYVCVVELSGDNAILCSDCKRVLASKKGDVLFSCCPTTYPTYEAAIAEINETDRIDGQWLCDYTGTFEL